MKMELCCRYFILLPLLILFSGCHILNQGSKYNFNDGKYHTHIFSNTEVYVLNIDDDTIAVFPVKELKDSTIIFTNQRVNYYGIQRKFKDNLTSHNFYRPSFDLDIMTIPGKYRFYADGVPNQFTTNFNGAVFGGYRVDAYKLEYRRTPLNLYKQNVKHLGYCAGFYAGTGNTPINGTTLGQPNNYVEYEGMLLIAGVAVNIAMESLNFGISFGADRLLDANHSQWIYEGRPNIGFTVGLNIK